MGTTIALTILMATVPLGSTISHSDRQKQQDTYQQYWGTNFSWKFDELPIKGSVRNHQVPYSGYIYPDNSGGTISIMRKYDRAFHQGRPLATAFEEWDVQAWKADVDVRGPLFGFRWGSRRAVPDWSGHCNGWAAAAIRHAEPQNSVVRNGVVFTPSDIKGLLAELYLYNEVVNLSGSDPIINAGLLHAVVTNWVGRGQHALGMEADPGEERWNYPVWAYNSDSVQRSPRQVEVKMNLGYVLDSNREYDESPRIHRVKSFHYLLDLNPQGEIIGGRFHRNSTRIAMLWLPLQPKAGRQPGNRLGNPHLNVQQVLSIWRDSVPAELRDKWVVVDPPREDRLLVLSDPDDLVPPGYAVRRVDAHLSDQAGSSPETRKPKVVVDKDWDATPIDPVAPVAELNLLDEPESDTAQNDPLATVAPERIALGNRSSGLEPVSLDESTGEGPTDVAPAEEAITLDQ